MNDIELLKAQIKNLYENPEKNQKWEVVMLTPGLNKYERSGSFRGDLTTEDGYNKLCEQIDKAEETGCASFTIQVSAQNKNRLLKTIQLQGQAPQQTDSDMPEMGSGMWEMFGSAFLGKTGLGQTAEKYGMAGVLLKAQEQTLSRQFAAERREEQMLKLTEESAVLRTENELMKKQIEELRAEIASLKDKKTKLEKVKEEYTRMSRKDQRIINTGGQILSQAALGLIRKSPMLSGLFAAEEQQLPPSAADDKDSEEESEMKIEEADERRPEPQQDIQQDIQQSATEEI